MTLAVWAAGALGVAVVTAIARRRGGPRAALELAAVADLAWCAGSLLVKQRVVLAELGLAPSSEGRALASAGAALTVLALLGAPRRVRPWFALAVAATATGLLHADLLYARFFGDLLSLAAVGAAGQLGQVGASVRSLVVSGDAWLWVDLVAGLWLALTLVRLERGIGRRWLRLLALALLPVVAAGAWAGVRLARSDAGVLEQVFRSSYLARDLGVLNFHAYDVGQVAARRLGRRPLTDRQLEEVTAWFAERAATRAGVGPRFGAARANNLLMIQVESLQWFVLSLEVRGQQVTPFLNRWAEQALVFSAVTDQTALGRSSDSELLTQVSLLPPSRGVAAFRYAGNDFTGLAELLEGYGYRSLSAVAFDGGFWNRRLTHAAYGFRRSLFAADFSPGEAIGWGLNDRDFMAQMVPRLAALEQPFCAWLLTLGLHHPFEGFPPHLRRLELGEWEGTPLGSYLHTMSFFDRAFATLIADLERTGIADRTVIVLWGDHDAGLDWRAELARLAGRPFSDAGWYLSQRVPVLIRVPGRPDLVGRIDTAAGHQDVAPTLLALLGVDPAPYAFLGRNLLGDPGDAPVVGEYHCWHNGHNLYLDRGPTLEDGDCFDLDRLERLPSKACREGFQDARRQVEMSRLVLEHDLQARLHRLLELRLGSAP
jgi:phosphoglycerol transferase MdoB-like AlkP superfamily enzyme